MEECRMLGKFGTAAVLALAFALPAHEAAAQNNTLGGAIFGGAAGVPVSTNI